MSEDNVRNTEVDYNFELAMPLSSLVDETYDTVEAAKQEGILEQNGRLNVQLLLKNASILLAAGDTKLAKKIFRTLIENGEHLSPAYTGMAIAFEIEQKIDLAIKAYREAIIYEPTIHALCALSELYIKQADYNGAISTLLRAKNLPTLDLAQQFELHKNLGNCYMHLGQLNNAESHYRKAYELDGQSDALHVNIGSLAIKKNDPATALLHFKEAIRLNSANAAAHTGSGLAYLAQNNKEAAHDAFYMALKRNIQDSAALFNLVKCAYELKKFSAAEEMLKAFMASNPININLLFSYAGVLYHQGKLTEAQEQCTRILSLKPDHEGTKKIQQMIQNKGSA
jgi:tetratricopeptide (TPR) repeat protein